RAVAFQPPAGDERARVGRLPVRAVVDLLYGEVAHARVVEARHHRVGGQQNHRLVHLYRNGAGVAIVGRVGGGVRKDVPHLHVFGKAAGGGDKAAVAIEAPHLELLSLALAHRAEERHVVGEEAGDVYDRSRRVFGARGDVEGGQDGLEMVVAHGLVDGQRVAGDAF